MESSTLKSSFTGGFLLSEMVSEFAVTNLAEHAQILKRIESKYCVTKKVEILFHDERFRRTFYRIRTH